MQAFVHNLRKMGFEPDEWRDRHSRPLLLAAAQWNYIRLVKWLVGQGCPLKPDAQGLNVLDTVQRNGFEELAEWVQARLDEALAKEEGVEDWADEDASRP